jgi:hypothetical protein
MNVRRCLRRLGGVAAALVLLLSVTAPVWAQRGKKAVEESTEPSYGLAYALVVLLIVLGLLVICRPGRRTREVKRPVK